MVVAVFHETEHTAKVQLANYIEGVPFQISKISHTISVSCLTSAAISPNSLAFPHSHTLLIAQETIPSICRYTAPT